ncbi:MAG: hypothetical protein E6J90_29675 [Deltaproteobacteria bacterium]|nr:MAG: hypothetical protein E6J91_52375 [Deltaproteobacteria bacterium]TMQ12903.1 MAG: hypothetical protein E6J90_29675 [Deltaproteobacteria bacterium]
MLLLRLLTTSLCAAAIVIAVVGPIRVTVVSPVQPTPSTACCGFERLPPVTVVDVAAAIAPSDFGGLIQLHAGERITAVNDRPLAEGRPLLDLVAELAPRAGGYLDLTVMSEVAERRVLMLLH